jgi:hypothetical protein
VLNIVIESEIADKPTAAGVMRAPVIAEDKRLIGRVIPVAPVSAVVEEAMLGFNNCT